MTCSVNVYMYGDSPGIEISDGYSDHIELRTGSDLLELLRDLIAAGNAHFGTTARLVEASGELNVAQLLSDDETAKSATYTWQDFRREHLAQFEALVDALPTTEKAPYTWAEYKAANQQALDEIAAFVGGTR